jgi:hypothetical protein
MNPSQLQNHFDAFYEDFWCEMCKYGEIEEVVVCDNNNDHLIGNVYARFKYEDSAQQACDALNSRWYAARPIYCELSPVTDFREACCRLNSGEGCVRGGFCNFIHRKEPSAELERELELATKKWLREEEHESESITGANEEKGLKGWKFYGLPESLFVMFECTTLRIRRGTGTCLVPRLEREREEKLKDKATFAGVGPEVGDCSCGHPRLSSHPP